MTSTIKNIIISICKQFQIMSCISCLVSLLLTFIITLKLTYSSLSAKTYCTVNIGTEHAGENLQISVLYSRDGSNLNHGIIVPKTVSSQGNLKVASKDAFRYYPDHALITVYDKSGNTLTTKEVTMDPSSGSQSF